MKKLILTMAVAIFGVSNMNAQLVMTGSDTIVDAGVVSVSQTLNVHHVMTSFQAVVTKVSGTVAGTVILEASLDGTNFVAVSTDTLNLTNVATNTKLWYVADAPFKYYRLKGTGSGTMAAILTGYCVASKR